MKAKKMKENVSKTNNFYIPLVNFPPHPHGWIVNGTLERKSGKIFIYVHVK